MPYKDPEKKREYQRLWAQGYRKKYPDKALKNGAALDHCHTTRVIRGILCNGCNTGIGCLGDDPVRMEKGAEYIRRNQCNPRFVPKSASAAVRGKGKTGGKAHGNVNAANRAALLEAASQENSA